MNVRLIALTTLVAVATACGPTLPPAASSDVRETVTIDDQYVVRETARDARDPIYDPVFVRASDVDLDPFEPIVGVMFEGEARAYPASALSGPTLVNDEIRGWPILVSW